jgi:hypothetical protein
MPTDTHPIDAPARFSLMPTGVFIVIVGLLATVVAVHPRIGSVEGSSTDVTATDTVTEWGD